MQLGKYTADQTRICRWKENFGSCHQRCSATVCNRHVILATLRYNDICLIKNDRAENGFFKKDREFVIEAITQNSCATCYIDSSWFDDKGLMMRH